MEQKPEVSLNQVNTKWRNIKEKFKKFEDNKKQTGAPHMSTPQFYDVLASFLLDRPAINPVEVGEAGLGHLGKKQAGKKNKNSSLGTPTDDNPYANPIASTSFEAGPLQRHIQKTVEGPVVKKTRHYMDLGVSEQVDTDVDPCPTTSQEGDREEIAALRKEQHTDAPASIPEEATVVNSPPLLDLLEPNIMLDTDDEDLAAPTPQIQIPEGRGRRKSQRIRPPTRTAVISDYLKNLQAGSNKQVEQTAKLLEEIEKLRDTIK